MSSELPSWVVPAADPWLGPKRPPSPGPGRAAVVFCSPFLRWKTVENPWKIMAKTMENQGKSGKIRENQGKSGKTEWVDGKIYWIYMSLAMKYIGFSCKIVPQKNDPVKNVPWNPKSAAGLYQQKHEAQTLTGKMHMFNSKNDKEVHWTSKTGDVIPKIACYTDKHVGFNQQKLSLSEEKHLQIPVVHVGVPFPCFITRGLLQQ